MHPSQLTAAAVRKQDGYSPLLAALVHYTDRGWTAHVFPWVVGVRGLINPSHIYALLEFLEILSKCRKLAVEQTVLASVKALYFMHQVRFGGLYGRLSAEADCHSNTSDSDPTDDEELRTAFPDQRRRASPNHAVSEVPASRPSDHDSGPTQANRASTYGAHADPERSDGTPNALVLLHCPCPDRQTALKLRLNPQVTMDHGTAAQRLLLHPQDSYCP